MENEYSPKLKVLIVDDARLSLTLMEKLIAIDQRLSELLDCTFCDDGLKAVEILKNERFDLLILDIMMPKISGFDIMRMNNDGALFDGVRIPTVCVSALSSDDRVETAMRLGCEKWISKPFDKETLLDAVRKTAQKVINGNVGDGVGQPFKGYGA